MNMIVQASESREIKKRGRGRLHKYEIGKIDVRVIERKEEDLVWLSWNEMIKKRIYEGYWMIWLGIE